MSSCPKAGQLLPEITPSGRKANWDLLAPTPSGPAGEPIDRKQLFYPSSFGITAFPGTVFTGDRGCSPSALLSNLTIEKQAVPVVEAAHYAIRLLQTPSNSPTSVPDNVVWLDLQTGVIVTGVPRLNWLQQTQVFNYTLLSPSLVDFARYNAALSSLTQLVIGLAFGKNQPGARYQCAASNTALEPLADYLEEVGVARSNSSDIDGGLKKGIEYRVPSGCTIELDASYAGDALGGVVNLSQGASKQPTEDNCCQLCRTTEGCNVFVFCPSFGGCGTDSSLFPAFGCQLKRLANLSADPAAFPTALARGPPVSFRSGRLG